MDAFTYNCILADAMVEFCAEKLKLKPLADDYLHLIVNGHVFDKTSVTVEEARAKLINKYDFCLLPSRTEHNTFTRVTRVWGGCQTEKYVVHVWYFREEKHYGVRYRGESVAPDFDGFVFDTKMWLHKWD